jgi:pantoate kinase
MPPTAIAFSPGHISGYFLPVIEKDPQKSGSSGAGIVIDEGVTVYATPARTSEVIIHRLGPGDHVREMIPDSPPVRSLMETLGVSASVLTWCHLPIGAGFGLSAAALLASATALNELFSLGLTMRECAVHAHREEITHRTGLGDVAACQGGGWECRMHPGLDTGILRRFDMPGPVATVTCSPLPSPGILASPSMMARVREAFPGGCPDDAIDLFRRSRIFAERLGLITPDVRKILTACDAAGIPASMTMLGNGVFALGNGAAGVLAPFGEVHILGIAPGGFHLQGMIG